MLKYLFDQYKTTRSISLGTRVYDFYGKFLIKTPFHKFQDVNPHLEREYYYNRGDRNWAEDIEESESNWRDTSLLFAQIRDEEAPRVSKAVFMNAIVILMILGGMYWTLLKILAGSV